LIFFTALLMASINMTLVSNSLFILVGIFFIWDNCLIELVFHDGNYDECQNEGK